jgi:hypothetical protein
LAVPVTASTVVSNEDRTVKPPNGDSAGQSALVLAAALLVVVAVPRVR